MKSVLLCFTLGSNYKHNLSEILPLRQYCWLLMKKRCSRKSIFSSLDKTYSVGKYHFNG